MTLTRPALTAPAPPMSQTITSMLRCQIGQGQYLMPLTKVLEIIRFVTPTPVPQTAPWVNGVMNLRGRVVPVMDLAVKFGESPSVPDEWTCIVLVNVDLDGDPAILGVVTTRVSEIHDLRPEDLEPPPSVGTQIRAEFLMGLFRLGEGFALALHIDRILSSNEQVSIRELGAEHRA